jgi:hypothetical protein
MITADPQLKADVLSVIQQRLAERASTEDRELVSALASVVFAEMPDAMALNLSPDAVAARIGRLFHFVTKTTPPEHQLYRGLPGIHVVARNPGEEEARQSGSMSGHEHEVTIVETHTPDAPCIFESLKNFFQREGLRVFSSIHPIFTVRRQWEHIV